MFCSYCGTQLPQDAVFCLRCGKQQKRAMDESTRDVVVLPPLSGVPAGSNLSPLGNAPVVPGTPSTTQPPAVPGTPSTTQFPEPSGASQVSPPHTIPLSPSGYPGPSTLPAQHSLADSQPGSFYDPSAGNRPFLERHQPTGGQRIPAHGLKLAGGFSRRAVIVGLAGATVVAVGGAIIWGRSSQGHPASSASGNSSVSLTPTLPPLGTTLYTYRGHANAQYGYIAAVAWSPNGQRIVSGGDDGTAQVWDATNGGHPFIYHGHSDAVNTVAWSPDGQRIASGAGGNINNPDNTVQVWDATDGNRLFIYRDDSYITAVAWSPDGKSIVSGGSDNTARVWDAANGSTLFTYNGHANYVGAVTWSPDSKRIASGSGDPYDNIHDYTVRVWDAADGSNMFIYRRHSGWVNSVAWSPNGQRIASGSADGTVHVWDAADGGHPFIYRGHSDRVNTVAWSPDGKRIASGSWDKIVQVWRAG